MNSQPYSKAKKIGLFLGPAVFLAIMLLPGLSPLSPNAQKVIAVAAFMLIWWITEAVSLPVAALLPMVLFPVIGVFDMKTAAAPYSSPIVYLFMGGFVVALAMEKWKLHKRIALTIVKLTGTNANGIIFGFMLATASLSMWISNTATTVMMLPIATSVIGILLDKQATKTKGHHYFSLSIMLGIAYAANVGGMATLIGTPPNTVLVGFMMESYDYSLSFAKWMMMGVPFSLFMLGVIFFVLVKVMYPNGLGRFEGSAKLIEEELEKLGPMSSAEKRVLGIFLTTALCWIFRQQLAPLLPGITLTDPGIAMAAAIVTFILPLNLKKGQFVLDWSDTERLPWGILLLFGGGLSLANGMSETGLVDLIGETIAEANMLSKLAVVAVMISVMLFLTELMSNVALVVIFLPVAAGISNGLGIDPFLSVIPITMASSCAFMLPMSTPPNAIVFASGHIKVSQMVKAGVLLNIISIFSLVVLYHTVIPLIFG